MAAMTGMRVPGAGDQRISGNAVYAPDDAASVEADSDPVRRGFLARMDFLDELQMLDLDFSD